MNESGKQLLNLMFRPGESICVSYNKFGYHSLPLEKILADDPVTLIPTEESCEKRGITWEEGYEKRFPNEMSLVSLNPIKGFRNDQNCTAFRNFLVEVDYGSLKEQLEYIKRMGLPYSACIFSGNKSLHFLVSLKEDVPNEKIWRMLAEWILNIVTLADDKTKNPSRGIRVPGVWREPKKLQRLVEIGPAISQKQLMAWLLKHPAAKPAKQEKRAPSGTRDFSKVKQWAKAALINGIDARKGRSNQWYAIAYEFGLAGYSEDDTIEMLSQYFTPERTFKEKEWLTTIKSAFKHVNGK